MQLSAAGGASIWLRGCRLHGALRLVFAAEDADDVRDTITAVHVVFLDADVDILHRVPELAAGAATAATGGAGAVWGRGPGLEGRELLHWQTREQELKLHGGARGEEQQQEKAEELVARNFFANETSWMGGRLHIRSARTQPSFGGCAFNNVSLAVHLIDAATSLSVHSSEYHHSVGGVRLNEVSKSRLDESLPADMSASLPLSS